MRSLTPKTIAIASLLAVVPLAGAYAASDPAEPILNNMSKLEGSRLEALVGQADSVRQGVAVAQQDKEIDGAQARMLDARVDGVRRDAERVAAADHGKIPTSRYHEFMRQLDNVNAHMHDHTGYPGKDISSIFSS
jgi:hypothetical protein